MGSYAILPVLERMRDSVCKMLAQCLAQHGHPTNGIMDKCSFLCWTLEESLIYLSVFASAHSLIPWQLFPCSYHERAVYVAMYYIPAAFQLLCPGPEHPIPHTLSGVGWQAYLQGQMEDLSVCPEMGLNREGGALTFGAPWKTRSCWA